MMNFYPPSSLPFTLSWMWNIPRWGPGAGYITDPGGGELDPHGYGWGWGGQRQREGKGQPLGMCPRAFRVPGSPPGLCHTETCLDVILCTPSGSRTAWGVPWYDFDLRGLVVLLEARVIQTSWIAIHGLIWLRTRFSRIQCS